MRITYSQMLLVAFHCLVHKVIEIIVNINHLIVSSVVVRYDNDLLVFKGSKPEGTNSLDQMSYPI